jgi:hypothetical protein
MSRTINKPIRAVSCKETSVVTPCKNCRGITVERYGSAWGTVRQVFDEQGNLIDTDISRLNFRESTVLRCTYCKKVRKDVSFVTQKLIRK